MKFIATLSSVKNRNSRLLPVFLGELISWAKIAPDELFIPRRDDFSETDIYTAIKPDLGPWTDLLHRKCVMLEVMRVLAGFESSWNFSEGRDVKNTPAGAHPIEIETGVFQVSANSMAFGADLRALVIRRCGASYAQIFIDQMKTDHVLAFEYIARLLRHTIRHNGPVLRHEIDLYLSRKAVKEFRDHLTV